MLINPLIIKILKPLEIPVALLKYNGSSTKYIVFSTTNQKFDSFYDDEANSEIINVGLNFYYTNVEDMALIEKIKTILKENNFTIISSRDVGCVDGIYNYAFYCRYENKF
ncbi:hypothetical protein PTM93_06085 [Clostridium perfringens]|nr:hypothetical protein [Clostridium perfringens]MDK0409061.1 hypothetical protein [Clostridium perfringens]MDK0443320.1 hypothetical protein [Clostridium perfringens]MDK0496864.1 hypothetical protein [Clostridium perfringens]MDK0499970.1 hypothetical protein [Clostridium perfringens]